MIRYKYVAQFNPPAPFVHVTLRNPKADRFLDGMPAQIDFGADRTVVPSHAAEELSLYAVRKIIVAGLGGELHTLNAFLAVIQIRDLQPLSVEVIVHDAEPHVLLGRDVLNHFRILLDGPNQVLEIG